LELIKSDCFSHVTLALILLTGRRPSEILKTAKFERVDAQNVLFSGQLKTRDCPTAKTAPFPIPVLADAKLVCEALSRLREMPQVKELADKPVKACNSKAGVLSETCDRHLGKLIKDCTPHELRAAYAQICLAYRRSDRAKRTDYEPYFAEILGHAEDDLDTSKKYKKFELLD
jgi:integrase